MSQLLTLKEIAKQLNVPESSLRKYREIFDDFIPGVGSGRGRRYKSEASEIFQDIREWRENLHMPWEAITTKLAEKYPVNVPSERRTLDLRTQETQHQPLKVAHQKPTALSVESPEDSDRHLKRLFAASEMHSNLLYAIAGELVRLKDMYSKMETKAIPPPLQPAPKDQSAKEISRLSRNLILVVESLSAAMIGTAQEQNQLLKNIHSRINGTENALNELARSGMRNIQIEEVKEKILSLRKKIEDKDRVIEDLKASFEIMKRENSELRAFKQQSIDVAGEKKRKLEKHKSQPLLKRILGTRKQVSE